MENLLRALIVDDYAAWRRFLRQTLSAEKKIEIIGEAADGFEAVEKGGELQPDLILLDIGLPAMSGIEAARILRKVSPKAKIVFVSENRSPEIVQEVLRIGGSGYVLKSDAGRELVPALRAVLKGKQFVSSSLFGVGAGILNRTQPRNSVTDAKAESPDVPHSHEAIFYSDDRVLLDHLTLFVGNAMRNGDAAVLLATEPHRQAVLSRLHGFGVKVSQVIEEGRYFAFDAEESLATFMVNGVIDADRLLSLFGSLITSVNGSTTGQHRRVALFGECVQLLWASGNSEAAIQMERLGTRLARMYDVDVLCGYSLAHGKMHPEIHQLICEQHSLVHRR